MIRRVLLVCSGNTCRSPMAEALMKDLWQKASPGWDLEVSSAGTGAMPGDVASQHAVTAMRTRGLDMAGHRSRRVDSLNLTSFDLILTMTSRHREHLLGRWPELAGRVYTLGEYAGAGDDISDPFGGTLQDYESTAVALEAKLQAVVDRIRKEGASSQ
ncbi:MAG TPA: low molecular weight protein arginine phosphatase [Symbiobacteriaceae bacterium]|nr:low molecular weight protein arginine phosphatase [Symbiobacteriaceae bacterium]